MQDERDFYENEIARLQKTKERLQKLAYKIAMKRQPKIGVFHELASQTVKRLEPLN